MAQKQISVPGGACDAIRSSPPRCMRRGRGGEEEGRRGGRGQGRSRARSARRSSHRPREGRGRTKEMEYQKALTVIRGAPELLVAPGSRARLSRPDRGEGHVIQLRAGCWSVTASGSPGGPAGMVSGSKPRISRSVPTLRWIAPSAPYSMMLGAW